MWWALLSPMVEIGFTNLSKSGRRAWPPGSDSPVAKEKTVNSGGY